MYWARIGTQNTLQNTQMLCERRAYLNDGGQRGDVERQGYSITSSARASSEGGTVRPSAFAVLRLTVKWNLIGCSTGRSLGLAPLSILSINTAARRCISTMLAP